MTLLQSILLGVVQGLTEFLPISSSAHLVIVPYLFGWEIPPAQAFVFDVLVQLGTLVAVISYFWRDIWALLRALLTGLRDKKLLSDPLARLSVWLLIATIPAGVFGLLVKDFVELAFASVMATAFFLLVTAALLVIAERVGSRQRDLEAMTWKDALWIGLFQAASIFPGLSRSGSTIAGGMMRDLQRPAAARFSFLISIPIMLAAGLFSSLDLLQLPEAASGMNGAFASLLVTFAAGFLSAALVGYLSIRWLLGFLARRPLYAFAVYCLALSLFVLGVTIYRS
jgi:undecaprenyl-diphosphatase